MRMVICFSALKIQDMGERDSAMKGNAVILIAEDDEGHFSLIRRNFQQSGLHNEMIRFGDGQAVLDYLETVKQKAELSSCPYLLFLDIRMPKVDGFEVLEAAKRDSFLRKMPVIVITTASDHQTIEQCHQLGCSMYLVKPVEYEQFVNMMRTVGNFLSIIELPALAAS